MFYTTNTQLSPRSDSSCDKTFQLAYGMSVVLPRYQSVTEVTLERTPRVFLHHEYYIFDYTLITVSLTAFFTTVAFGCCTFLRNFAFLDCFCLRK